MGKRSPAGGAGPSPDDHRTLFSDREWIAALRLLGYSERDAEELVGELHSFVISDPDSGWGLYGGEIIDALALVSSESLDKVRTITGESREDAEARRDRLLTRVKGGRLTRD